jgi:hypothetical protein
VLILLRYKTFRLITRENFINTISIKQIYTYCKDLTTVKIKVGILKIASFAGFGITIYMAYTFLKLSPVALIKK